MDIMDCKYKNQDCDFYFLATIVSSITTLQNNPTVHPNRVRDTNCTTEMSKFQTPATQPNLSERGKDPNILIKITFNTCNPKIMNYIYH